MDDDPRVRQMLRRIGTRLAGRLTGRKQTIRFSVADRSAGEAFALPGGFIFVTRALLGLCAL